MKKRKNIFISVITCFASICLMMFGVYASANPSVSINGQVSYSVHDAKVLVQGKANGQADANGTAQVSVEYPTVADTTNITESQITSGNQYLSYTTGAGFGDASDDLKTWELGGLNFYEDNSGVKPITLSFKITNLSNYPVQGSVSFDVANISNVQRETSGLTSSNTVYLDSNASKQISVTYTVVDDAQTVANANISMKMAFEQTSKQVETNLLDWEYTFDGDSYTITKYVGTFPVENNILVVPSTINENGTSYPVKTIGAVEAMTVDELFTSVSTEEELYETLAQATVFVDYSKVLEGDEEYIEEYMSSFPTVIIPEGIEVINACAFYMTPIQSLPTTIKKVLWGACHSVQLMSETLDLSNCEEIGESSFESLQSSGDLVVTFGENLKSIPKGAFDGCSSLVSITIPSTKVTEIGEKAFRYCTSLTQVILPEGLESIFEGGFCGCTSLKSITIPSTIGFIDCQVFYNCTTLTEVTFKGTVEASISLVTIDTFGNCSSLQTIYVPSASVDAYTTVLSGCLPEGCTIVGK